MSNFFLIGGKNVPIMVKNDTVIIWEMAVMNVSNAKLQRKYFCTDKGSLLSNWMLLQQLFSLPFDNKILVQKMI